MLVQTLKSTVTEINNVNFSIWTEIQLLKKHLTYQAKISSFFGELELTIHVVDKQLIQLQEALDVTAKGYLSSMLISPTKLYAILNEVVGLLKLPTGLSLIIENEIDKVYNYYQLAKVHAIAIKNVIRLITR